MVKLLPLRLGSSIFCVQILLENMTGGKTRRDSGNTKMINIAHTSISITLLLTLYTGIQEGEFVKFLEVYRALVI